jgi:arylsulfatase A-like enzyme
MNLFATIVDYLEMPPRPSDGPSLRGLIEGVVNEDDACVVTEWLSDLQSQPSHMVLKGGWKLMRPDPRATKLKKALYNLNDDPYELTNLLADDNASDVYAVKVAELETCFQDWLARTSANKL